MWRHTIVEVGNKTVIRIATKDDDVQYDTHEGELILYNNGESPEGYIIHTGVYLSYSDDVVPKVRDLDDKPIDYAFTREGELHVVDTGALIGEPACVVSFIPVEEHPIIKQFYGMFIKVYKESITCN
jgi:hypothetical protein